MLQNLFSCLPLKKTLFLVSLFIMNPQVTLPMDPTQLPNKEYHLCMIEKWEQMITRSKASPQNLLEESQQKKNTQALFSCYMQKAAHYFYLGDKENQLSTYKGILKIPGLSSVDIAYVHTNIAVVYLHLNRILVAAAHLTKAEDLVCVKELAQATGHETFRAFTTIYYKASLALEKSCLEQALNYREKILQLPEQEENPHACIHLDLAIGYDRLLNFHLSLTHALHALNSQPITPKLRDRALCYAAIGSAETDKKGDAIIYFNKINTFQNLANEERFLAFMVAAKSWISKGEWDQGITFQYKALESLGPNTPQYVLAKYDLGISYGKIGNKKKEKKIYGEVLGAIKTHTFELDWQASIRPIKMSLETFFFVKEMKKFEKHLKEDFPKKEPQLPPSQQEMILKKHQEKNHQKEASHKRLIEKIRQVQREAFENERHLEEMRRQYLEKEKKRAEARKKHKEIVQKTSSENPEFTTSEESCPPRPDIPKPKMKTRGVFSSPIIEKEQTSEPLKESQTVFPSLRTRARVVFNQIEDEDWSFTREEYSCYLEDLHCVRRDRGTSHRIFQLPKTLCISLKRNSQEIYEEIFLNDEEIMLGSVTLPPWQGRHIPFYLRRQLRSLHEKIMYSIPKWANTHLSSGKK